MRVGRFGKRFSSQWTGNRVAVKDTEPLKILVPLDGSPDAEFAVAHAVALGKAFSATIYFLRVIEPDARFWASTETVDWQLRRRQAEAYLRRIAEQLRTVGAQVQWFLEEGKVAETIVDFCRTRHIDLVVMTRFGRGGAKAFRFGGTAQKVVFSVPGSVMLLDPEKALSGKPLTRYGHVLVPVDGSRRSEWGVGIGAIVAQAHGARLTLLQIIEKPQMPDRLWMTSELQQLAGRMTELQYLTAQRCGQELAAQLPQGLDAQCKVIIADDVPRAIQQFVDDNDVQIIIVSAHGAASESSRAYGNVSHALLEHCTCPVLVCRTPEHAFGRSRFQSAYLSEPLADTV